MRRLTSLLVLIPLLLGSTVMVTAAQDASPAPAQCTVEPRTTDELLDLWFPETGTPAAVITEEAPTAVTIPLGVPIGPNESIFAGITVTVEEVFACFAAGDFPRATALFTDDLVAQFGPGPGETREDVIGFLEATPVPEADADPIELVAITDAMVLEDGRVGAFVVDREVIDEQPVTSTVYVIFEQAGGRWLVDEVIEFSPGTEE